MTALQEYTLAVAGREWRVHHAGLRLSYADEIAYYQSADRPAFGISLWPAAIALAQELAAWGDVLRGKMVLELGAGTGLPGLVAASLGARVVQSDRDETALDLCRQNARHNGVAEIEYLVADWADFRDERCYDLIIGADILYAGTFHPPLERIFQDRLAPGGRILIGDPMRSVSLQFMEALEGRGWRIAVSLWGFAEGDSARRVGVFTLQPPP